MDHEQCAACDFDGAAYGPSQLLDAIRELGPQWRRLLLDAGDDLRLRPAPETWSALEYAAHSRDVTALHVFGVEQALTIDEPRFPDIAASELVERALQRATPQKSLVSLGWSWKIRLENLLIWPRHPDRPHGPEASLSAGRGVMSVSFSSMRSMTRTTMWSM